MPTTRPTARGRATQAAIDAAARKVIAEKGFLNTSVADIAKESGRSPASFYNYYDSKEDLMARWARSFREDVGRRGYHAAESGLSPRDRVHRAVRAHVETYRTHLAEMIGVFQLAMVSTEFARYWHDLCAPAIEWFSESITRAQVDGYCPGIDAELTATAMVSMLNQYCYEHFSADGIADGEDDELLISTLAQIWYHAIYWR